MPKEEITKLLYEFNVRSDVTIEDLADMIYDIVKQDKSQGN